MDQQSNEGLDTVEIVGVTEEGHRVCFHLQLPGSPNLEQRFDRPLVWGANCNLKRILDAYNLGPDEIETHIGTQVPVTRKVVDGTLRSAQRGPRGGSLVLTALRAIPAEGGGQWWTRSWLLGRRRMWMGASQRMATLVNHGSESAMGQ